MKKKIAIFLPHIKSGGLTHVMLLLAGGLASKDYFVELVVLNLSIEQTLKNKVPKNVKLVKINAKRTATALFPLAIYLNESKPDILLSGGPTSNCVFLLAHKIVNISCLQIITEHSLASVDVFDSKKFIDRSLPFIMRWLYKKADKIVAVSNAVKNDLVDFLKLDSMDVDVIYNPVVNKGMLEQADVNVKHCWFNSQYKVLIFVGRLETVKNLPLALKAFSLIKDEKIKFIIVGDGPEKESLKELANKLYLSDRVDLIGYKSNPYSYIKNADALLLCSKWEGLPTVVIESLALGVVPVVTSNLAGAKEIINKKELGYIAENNNPEDLAKAIVNAVNSNMNVETLKRRGNEFDLEKSIIKYEEAFTN